MYGFDLLVTAYAEIINENLMKNPQLNNNLLYIEKKGLYFKKSHIKINKKRKNKL